MNPLADNQLQQDSQALLYSSLCDDPDLADIVQMFVDEMPAQLESLWSAFEREDWATLAASIHQLKGDAGSYGFDELTPITVQTETLIRARADQAEIRNYLSILSALCNRLRGGMQPRTRNLDERVGSGQRE